MDVTEFNKQSHIPAFGNWDYADGLPITQYFESARQASVLRYSSEERDLYLGGDLYGEELKEQVIPVVPRKKKKKGGVCDVMEPLQEYSQPCPTPRAPKAVDDDLYKISPQLLETTSRRKKTLGFFSRCLIPICFW